METMNVEFDELTQMASEQHGSGPDLHGLTSRHIRSGLVLNQNPSVAFNLISAATLFLPDTVEASSSSSTSIYKDAPSLSTSPNNEATNSLINSTNVEPIEEVSEFDSDTFTNLFAPPNTYSAKTSSRIVDTSNIHTFQQSPIYIKRWTKNHQLVTIISDPSKPISTRRQLSTDALWWYFNAFLAKVEPKNYKEAMEESCWIEAMKEEIHEFERLEVWELVPRLEKAMIISLKWIFKVKLDEYGGVMKNKAQKQFSISNYFSIITLFDKLFKPNSKKQSR
ncbi:integrase, catalytic region, zinc finger, CCHC-type containing protein [Tanacetum coccineum]